jgi:alpha-tubulin suppressor-like RCC1 family protein
VVAIAAGGRHSLALKNDGTLLAWGRSNEGQIAVP